jgi:SulP family sulfate permease
MRPADVLDLLAGVRILRRYERDWLIPDGLAALTVWALLVPQALAYAQLGGFDPVVGLYAAIGAIVGYALLGGVRGMSVGPEATIALLTATIVAPLAGGDPARYIALAGGLALMAGILLCLAGIARLGFIARYLSRPLLTGYVTGSAIVMIISQLDSLLGVTIVARDDPPSEFVQTVLAIPDANLTTLSVGLGVIAIALVIRRVDRRLPAYLIAVGVAIAVSVAADLAGQGVAVVGEITPGLPSFGLPDIQAGDLPLLLTPALAVALLVYADSGVTAQVLARRGGYRVDADGEFFGLGAANIGSALTSGFAVNGSQSRSFTAADAGARSPLSSLLVLALVLATLLVLTPLFEPLPKAALAGVIIVVAAGLIDVDEFRRLARISRAELGLAIAGAAIVVIVGMLAGVVIVALVSLLLVAHRASQPRTVTLVRVPGSLAYRSVETAGQGEAVPGLVVYRFDGPLFFANAPILADDIRALVGDVDPPVRWFVFDAEAVVDVDSTAISTLRDVIADLEGRGVTLALARVKRPVADLLERVGLLDDIGRDRVFLEVDEAAEAYLASVH